MSGTSARALQPALDRHHYVDRESFERERVLLREWTCIARLDELGLTEPGRRLLPSGSRSSTCSASR